jgi:hypothetical protein
LLSKQTSVGQIRSLLNRLVKNISNPDVFNHYFREYREMLNGQDLQQIMVNAIKSKNTTIFNYVQTESNTKFDYTVQTNNRNLLQDRVLWEFDEFFEFLVKSKKYNLNALFTIHRNSFSLLDKAFSSQAPPSAIKLLVENGADPNIFSHLQRTAIHSGCEFHSDFNTIAWLVDQRGGNIHQPSGFTQETPIDLICARKSVNLVSSYNNNFLQAVNFHHLIYKWGVNPTGSNKKAGVGYGEHKGSPLVSLLKDTGTNTDSTGFGEILNTMLSAGIDLSQQKVESLTPLQYHLPYASGPSLKALFKHGANVFDVETIKKENSQQKPEKTGPPSRRPESSNKNAPKSDGSNKTPPRTVLLAVMGQNRPDVEGSDRNADVLLEVLIQEAASRIYRRKPISPETTTAKAPPVTKATTTTAAKPPPTTVIKTATTKTTTPLKKTTTTTPVTKSTTTTTTTATKTTTPTKTPTQKAPPPPPTTTPATPKAPIASKTTTTIRKP